MVGGGSDNYYGKDKEKVVVETVDDEIADDVPKGRDSYEVAPAKLNIYMRTKFLWFRVLFSSSRNSNLGNRSLFS